MTQKTWGGGGGSHSPSLNTPLNGWSRKEYRFISIGEKKSDKEEKDYLLSEQEKLYKKYFGQDQIEEFRP